MQAKVAAHVAAIICRLIFALNYGEGRIDVTGQKRTILSGAISTKHLCEVIVQEHPDRVESAAQGLKCLILLELGR